MDRLWAPWRIHYVRSNNKTKKCIFCYSQRPRTKKQAILQTRYSLAILNLYPYNNGHMMVCPKRHVKDLAQLKPHEVLDLFAALTRVQKLLVKVLKPHGFNIGINTSMVAGAGIPGHLHIHIVPRWIGDTNFMPVIYQTKVISQSLDQLYTQLRNAESKNSKRT
ncbi:MAG: HIT domain-containing protein [Candidatus Omnitrophota bacterium]|nr:MAG: HIT domain-containing protein [Candidatus Omnitrophota bacterium]